MFRHRTRRVLLQVCGWNLHNFKAEGLRILNQVSDLKSVENYWSYSHFKSGTAKF